MFGVGTERQTSLEAARALALSALMSCVSEIELAETKEVDEVLHRQRTTYKRRALLANMAGPVSTTGILMKQCSPQCGENDYRAAEDLAPVERASSTRNRGFRTIGSAVLDGMKGRNWHRRALGATRCSMGPG
jgi:hypothetical protein